jgi:hypothetical protein
MRVLRGDRGATLVEAAIALPLLLLLIFGVVDFGRFMAANSAVNTATREAARFASAVGDTANGIPHYVDCDEIRAAGTGFDLAIDLEPSHFAVEYDGGPGTALLGFTCPAGGPSPDPSNLSDGDRVIVTVTRDFEFVTPFIDPFFGSVTLESVDRRTLQAP